MKTNETFDSLIQNITGLLLELRLYAGFELVVSEMYYESEDIVFTRVLINYPRLHVLSLEHKDYIIDFLNRHSNDDIELEVQFAIHKQQGNTYYKPLSISIKKHVPFN